ncbi:MAG TPA: RNA methyltransferase [Hyphomonadaceae bacterium]|nr:RNA methyltransferase [Hyphomonadaceae bacterium]
MTKDRPRNRPGNGRKSGDFGGRDGGGPRDRSGAPNRGREAGADHGDRAGSPSDKPWTRDRAAARPGGESHKHGQGKPGGFNKGGQNRFEQKRRDSGRSQPGPFDRREASFEEHGEVWIWGIHAAAAVLANPMRRISKGYVSPNAAERAGLDVRALPKFIELMEPKEIDLRLPPGAVHQGLAVRCKPLDGPDISDAAVQPDKPLVILDQVTDPQNVGAIFRSAAAFGIGGVVMQTRNAPALGGALAKAATGAIEIVDEIRAVNLSRAIDALTDAGWKVIGLDGSAEQTLDEAFAGNEPLAIVMGAEGEGLRQGVAKACSGLARIPIGVQMESLNVSNAAAIAFYEASKRGGAAPPAPKTAPLPSSEDDADDDGFDGEAD